MTHKSPSTLTTWQNIVRWFDSEAHNESTSSNPEDEHRISWFRCMPFLIVHLACIGVIFTGVSTVAVMVCLGMFWLRMFAITAFYHRYFAHRSFKANRVWQFMFAVLGNMASQRGPLWWAAHHRNHHKHSDEKQDLHSPIQHGFLHSHISWFMTEKGFKTDYSVIKDLAKFPELRFLNRFDSLVPISLAIFMFALGEWIHAFWPELGTNGWQMLMWGFFVSTVLLFHGTFTINSLGHVWGNRPYQTKDHSRNNFVLALLTLGEGWHNNHHRFAVSARQGFVWWQVDITYYILKVMSYLGIVHSLNPVPSRIVDEAYGQKSR